MPQRPGGGTTSTATTASTFDPLDVCHCFDDESHMDILHLACCKTFIHRECLLSWLEFESSCPYCRRPIENIATIQNQPAIDRTKDLPSTPPMTSQQRGIGRKHDLQDMEVDDARISEFFGEKKTSEPFLPPSPSTHLSRKHLANHPI